MKATKIIRDVIHSDIVFDQRFMKIIDTKEFQRLNRIKQLSCEYMVFPTATHCGTSVVACHAVFRP